METSLSRAEQAWWTAAAAVHACGKAAERHGISLIPSIPVMPGPWMDLLLSRREQLANIEGKIIRRGTYAVLKSDWDLYDEL